MTLFVKLSDFNTMPKFSFFLYSVQCSIIIIIRPFCPLNYKHFSIALHHSKAFNLFLFYTNCPKFCSHKRPRSTHIFSETYFLICRVTLFVAANTRISSWEKRERHIIFFNFYSNICGYTPFGYRKTVGGQSA